MSLISYVRRFGVRNAVAKAQAVIMLKLFSRTGLREAASVGTIEGLRSVDTATMSADYKAYVEDQITRSIKRSVYLNPLRARFASRDQLIQQMARVSRTWKVRPDSALSIGCRDERELDTIARLLRSKDVIGVDLFSASPRIRVADMHNLPFESSKFDVAFAIHCMEHSYDARQSLSEMARVTKPGGLLGIEVPIGFDVTPFDRNDFRGIPELARLFPERSVAVLWAELENRDELSKPPSLRVILQKVKSDGDASCR